MTGRPYPARRKESIWPNTGNGIERVKGIKRGTLEYREGAIWGNPYLRVLRSQLEAFISEERGKGFLSTVKNQSELKKINKEISKVRKTLTALQARKAELENNAAV